MKVWILPLATLLGFVGALQGNQQGSAPGYHFDSEGKAVTPFELTKNVTFFQLRLKGSARALWFSLDSGAGSSYIDTEAAKSLGLQLAGNGTVHGAGSGDIPVQYVESVTFELPGLESGGHRLNVTDFKPLNDQFGRAEDGLLGYDFLSRYVVAVDYAEQKMTVYDPSKFNYAGLGQAFAVHFRHRWPYINGAIKVKGLEAQSGEFLVDSGSGDAVDDPAIAKSTGELRKVQTGVGLGTPGEGIVGRAEYFELGRFRLAGPITSCCSSNPDDERKIGGEILRRFTVIFDYPHQRIILEQNRNFSEPFPDA
jgi:hypothetical protein